MNLSKVLKWVGISVGLQSWAMLWAATPLVFGVMGDAGIVNRATEQTRASMTRMGVNQLILPGDNLYKPRQSYTEVWDRWKNAGFTFNIVAIGNHNKSYADEMAYFRMTNEFYTVAHGGVRFVIMNSDHDSWGKVQAEWFDRVLSAATEKAVFVVFHHPFYTASSFHTWMEKPNFHRALRPLFFKHREKITAFLLGHDHLSTLINMGGLPVFIAGAAHEQRPDTAINYVENGVRVQTAWLFKGEPSWGKLEIDGESGASRFTFIDSRNDRVLCAVRLQAGRAPQGSLECGSSGLR